MESDIEDLESLFSEHFGRTPLSTPWGSQEEEECESGENGEQTPTEPDPDEPMINVEQRAREYLETLPLDRDTESDSDSVDNEATSEVLLLPQNDDDAVRISQYRNNGCGCKKNCVDSFSDSELYKHILNVMEMEKQDKELYIMATVVDNSNKDVTKRGKKRQKGRHDFTVLGKSVCRSIFMLAFDVKRTCLQNILSHVDEHGVVQRVHGNTGKKPSKSLQFNDIKFVVTYLSKTAEEIGLPQPAAPRGSDNMPPIYLPSSTTKIKIHADYSISCTESAPPKRTVHYTTFCNIWKQCLPHIKIASPRDDVCATCEKMRKNIMDSRTEEEKLENSEMLKRHILNAQKERETYNSCVTRAKETNSMEDGAFIHFTFDYSQNVCIPHHSRQMGPTYFMSLRKVQLFGVRNDGYPKQYNFLIDENETIGPDGTQTHGPNSVLSMLDWVLERDHIGETSISIHADNCPGQNKNQYTLGYLMWRVMSGRHKQIEYFMQVPGHARCHVDAGFAAVKRLYRRTDTDTIDQLEEVVDKSASTNVCIRYPAWTWRDWKSFLQPFFKPLPGIRKLQYFRFHRDQPGVVTVKESTEGDERGIDIRKSRDLQFEREHLPHVLQPGGMSSARQRYLYTTVRPYVRPAFQDVTCPPLAQ